METMQFQITIVDLFLEQYFLHLCGPFELIGMHKKLSLVFSVDLITPWSTSLTDGFPLFLSCH